jgi:hypothetical protein
MLLYLAQAAGLWLLWLIGTYIWIRSAPDPCSKPDAGSGCWSPEAGWVIWSILWTMLAGLAWCLALLVLVLAQISASVRSWRPLSQSWIGVLAWAPVLVLPFALS